MWSLYRGRCYSWPRRCPCGSTVVSYATKSRIFSPSYFYSSACFFFLFHHHWGTTFVVVVLCGCQNETEEWSDTMETSGNMPSAWITSRPDNLIGNAIFRVRTCSPAPDVFTDGCLSPDSSSFRSVFPSNQLIKRVGRTTTFSCTLHGDGALSL